MATALVGLQALLRELLGSPSLAAARALEEGLRSAGYGRKVFGRINQKASLEANSESDRGVAERLANAFDASLTAARVTTGIKESSRALTPRKAAQRFYSPSTDKSEWRPQDPRITVTAPFIQFWVEAGGTKVRHRKYHTPDGLCTVLVSDSGIGMLREEMPRTILDLNSDSKLRTFEAIGQFGHGGSSSLAFCESVLIVTQPRSSAAASGEFYWTLIAPERVTGDSKQELVRYWFCAEDGLPLTGDLKEFPELRPLLPGTSVWHFGYSRGDWIRRIAGPEQSNPWGRLGRLFFSYPLPFYVRGQLARTDTDKADVQRQLKGAFFRLLEAAGVEYASGEKSESLILDGTKFGEFHVFVFVLEDPASVRGYVDQLHPVIGTLDGQNHGELTRQVIAKAGLPELSSSTVVEVRLDGLDSEARSNIIANSRESLKKSAFTRELESRLVSILEADEVLRELEQKRQERKAKEASADMSKRLSAFLSSILSDAKGGATSQKGSGALGKGRVVRNPLPEVPASDPPALLEFLYESPLKVPEGVTKMAKFRSDARPPKYSFYGDNPRLFAELRTTGPLKDRVAITGRADLNAKGYGTVSVSCITDAGAPIEAEAVIGELFLTLQSASGRTLTTKLPVGVTPKPPVAERRKEPDVSVEVTFSSPDEALKPDLVALFGEEKIADPGTKLIRLCDSIQLDPLARAYASDRADRSGLSVLRVEINAANQTLRELLTTCKTAEERTRAKERYCQDVVIDCYQHEFQLESVPEVVFLAISTHDDEEARAAEVFLNHDKAIRFARVERDRDRAGK